MNTLLRGIALGALLTAAGSGAQAADIWISSQNGNIGLVDTGTGALVAGTLHNTGQALTDIGFVGSQMFGTTFTDLYSVNDTSGASTHITGYSVTSGMNALVGSGSNLLGASFTDNNVYNITLPGGGQSVFKAGTLPSAGDLAFAGGTLYESVVDSNGLDALYNVTAGTKVADFSSGATTFNSVFGLADDGTTMYAIQGTDIYSVNLTNGDLTHLSSFAADNIGSASGSAFVNENVRGIPEPSTWVMMGLGFGLLGLGAVRKRRATPALG